MLCCGASNVYALLNEQLYYYILQLGVPGAIQETDLLAKAGPSFERQFKVTLETHLTVFDQ